MGSGLWGGGSQERHSGRLGQPSDRFGLEDWESTRPSLDNTPGRPSSWTTRPSLDNTPGRPSSWTTRPSLDTTPKASLTGVGERSSELELPDFKVSIQDEATGAIAEYTVDKFEDKILNSLWDLGQSTAQKDLPLEAEEVIAALDKDVHVVGLGDPSKAVLSDLSVPGESLWSSIIQEAPIGIIDKPLGSIRRWVAIAGIIAGVMTGHMAMAYACFKELVHSEVHELAVAALEHWMTGDHSRSPDSPSKMNYAVASSDPTTSSLPEIRLSGEISSRARLRQQLEYERLRRARLRQRSDWANPSDRRP